MPDIIFSIVIIALICLIAISQYITTKEREKLLKILMARNLNEITENEVVEKMKEDKPTQSIPSDVEEMNPDNDIAFDKHIESQLTS